MILREAGPAAFLTTSNWSPTVCGVGNGVGVGGALGGRRGGGVPAAGGEVQGVARRVGPIVEGNAEDDLSGDVIGVDRYGIVRERVVGAADLRQRLADGWAGVGGGYRCGR